MSRCAYLDLDGTLLGPGGSLLTEDGRSHSDAAVRALGLLREHDVPVVLVSGRSRVRLEAVAIAVGADGALAEMGALDVGYPTASGQTVHEAIVATGLPRRLLEREDGLEVHPLAAAGGREGSYVVRGRAGPDAGAWIASESDGSLRLADNGHIGGGHHVYHLLPAAASKARAVELDLERRGLDGRHSLAVGDSRQDLDMGRAVGTVAIVANGAEADTEVADAAPWVTAGRHGRGVLEAVGAWLEGTAPQAGNERA
mgnify:CR=1 FL=1